MGKRGKSGIESDAYHMRTIFKELGMTQIDVARKVFLLKRENTKEAQAELKAITDNGKSFSESVHLCKVLNGDWGLTIPFAHVIGQAIGIDYRYLLPEPKYSADSKTNFKLLRRVYPAEVAYLSEDLRRKLENAEFRVL